MGEYEPKDSRNITGTAHTPDGRWTGDKVKPGHGGNEYEPRDSRNVTGAAPTQDGRWTNVDGQPPLAAGDHATPQSPEEAADQDDDEPVMFEPDEELAAKIRAGQHE